MKRTLTILFAAAFMFSTSCINASGTTHFKEKDEEKNHYSWRPTDESQERQAVGMLIWGVSIAVAAAILSAIIPNSPAKDSTTGQGGSGSGTSVPGGSGS